jgi:hypothetical protein
MIERTTIETLRTLRDRLAGDLIYVASLAELVNAPPALRSQRQC